MNTRVAIVESGIGAIVASKLAQEGYEIILVKDEPKPEFIEQAILRLHEYEKVDTFSFKDYKSPEEWQKKNKRWKSR